MAICLFNLSYLPVARFLPTVLAFSLQWRQLSLPCCGVPSAYLTVASSLPTLLWLPLYLSVRGALSNSLPIFLWRCYLTVSSAYSDPCRPLCLPGCSVLYSYLAVASSLPV
jgi:hypothetical protein